jgi:putative intracellular protease/amidase
MQIFTMKNRSKKGELKLQILIYTIVMGIAFVYTGCKPLREFYSFPAFRGANKIITKSPAIDPLKKTIIIIADNEGTEVFDLMAPFYLFSATRKANVLIVSQKINPIIVRKGLFLMPHFTFKEIDSMKLEPSLLVIPALSPMDGDHQSPIVTQWIRKNYKGKTKILSICEGALTAAATQLYDNKPITTHAITFSAISAQYKNAIWVNNTAITKSGNLYSTAGVTNAVEGSLLIIDELFGSETAALVMKEIHYPYAKIKIDHKSFPLTIKNKLTIANKIFFGKNKNIGVLLQNGMSEFELAAVLDSYHRTFPSGIKSYTLKGISVTTKYGLTVLPTGTISKDIPDEIHILLPEQITVQESAKFGKNVVRYHQSNSYIIDRCLGQIKSQYGITFYGITKQLLDYN